MMNWEYLLSEERLRRPNALPPEGRNVFQADRDRIIFSSAFRRLADKTQVHPLSENDHVRTRLTHSIEVASVGRSLGTLVGQAVAPKIADKRVSPDDFGYIVEAACLAHDLGNPPFGHSGEQAISDWFRDPNERAEALLTLLSEHQRLDLTRFEGNAQGFRIVSNLENHRGNGGLQLSYAVLGSFCKYPCSSEKPKEQYVGWKKYGFLALEANYFIEVAERLHLIRVDEHAWRRHPLAFLIEAADDICYRVIDLEDGLEVRRVTLREAEELLLPIAQPEDRSYMRSLTEREQLSYLRALAIDRLIRDVATVFLKYEQEVLAGALGSDGFSLIDHTEWADILERIRKFTRERECIVLI